MPANNFSKVDWVCMDTLMLLKHKCEIVAGLRTDYEDDFKKDFAVGDRVRVKYPWRPIIRNGLGYTPQAIERIETEVVCDQVMGSDFDYSTVDKLLNMERGEEKVRAEYNDKIATYLAAEIDKRAAEYIYKNTNNIVGVLGTNPTTFDATSAAARQRMVELDCPDSGKKRLFVPPAVMRSIKAGTPNIQAYMHPAEEIERLYKKGVVGNADGFTWHESMSLKSHTAGTWAGAVTLSSAVANGAQSLPVTCTTGDTFLEGDVIGIGTSTASVYPVNPVTRERTQSDTVYTVTVAQNVTGVASAATVPIKETIYFSGPYQNVDLQPASGATLTLFPGTTSPNGKSGKQGLAVHGEGFAFVNLPLPMPKKGTEDVIAEARDPETGLWIGFIRWFDPVERKWCNRIDSGLFGFGRLHVEACSVRILCK